VNLESPRIGIELAHGDPNTQQRTELLGCPVEPEPLGGKVGDGDEAWPTKKFGVLAKLAGRMVAQVTGDVHVAIEDGWLLQQRISGTRTHGHPFHSSVRFSSNNRADCGLWQDLAERHGKLVEAHLFWE
jgi:hypothetical protein